MSFRDNNDLLAPVAGKVVAKTKLKVRSTARIVSGDTKDA